MNKFDKLFIERVLQYLIDIIPYGMPHLLVNGYSFEWNGTHWEFVGISKPTGFDHRVLDLDNEF